MLPSPIHAIDCDEVIAIELKVDCVPRLSKVDFEIRWRITSEVKLEAAQTSAIALDYECYLWM